MLKLKFDGTKLHSHAAKAIGMTVRLFDGMEVAMNLPLKPRAVGIVVSLRWSIDSGEPWPVFMVAFDEMFVELNEFEIEWKRCVTKAAA